MVRERERGRGGRRRTERQGGEQVHKLDRGQGGGDVREQMDGKKTRSIGEAFHPSKPRGKSPTESGFVRARPGTMYHFHLSVRRRNLLPSSLPMRGIERCCKTCFNNIICEARALNNDPGSAQEARGEG